MNVAVPGKQFVTAGPKPIVCDDRTESLAQVNDGGNPEMLLFGGNSTGGTSRFELDVSSLQEK